MNSTLRKVKAACGNCGGQPRDHEVLIEHSKDWHDDENEERGADAYQICKCQDCGRICFRQEGWSTYDIDPETGQYPKTVHVYPEASSTDAVHSQNERHPWLVQRETDIHFMELAVEEAKKSRSEPGRISPRVAAFNQHLADIRNLCDHDKTIKPTADQVDGLTKGVAKVVKTLF
jgi:hypothetical protein